MVALQSRTVEQKLGRYKILGELGRGAMGAVYRAVDPLIEREVAIKTLLPNLPPEVMAEVKERFIREARSAGRLNHPNIVTIFDVGEQDGVAYIAMELLEGRSLQQVLKDERLTYEATAELVAQVADALDAAYQYKIVHRDVKPANVMIAPTGRAKLTDFGVARMESSSMTQTGAALGSPKYMSPEQVLGLATDPRSDIFSLGVMLYEMLGRPHAFRASDRHDRVLAHEPHRRRAASAAAPGERADSAGLRPDRRPRAREKARPALQPRRRNGGRPARGALRAARLQELAGLRKDRDGGPAAGGPGPALATQLITDLDKFTSDFEREEQERIKSEDAERARKKRRSSLGRGEGKRREAFHRTEATAGTVAASGIANPGDDQFRAARRARLPEAAGLHPGAARESRGRQGKGQSRRWISRCAVRTPTSPRWSRR